MLTKTFLQRITDAHSWLGFIISGLLFVVFFCGSIALYRGEIQQWAVQPHLTLAKGEAKPLSEIMAIAIDGVPFNAKEHLSLILPTEQAPYYEAHVDVEYKEGEEDELHILIDPVSGKKVSEGEQFILAEFIYQLHYYLKIPYGVYIVGLVTLFFFLALVTGVLLHAKKLVSNFFKYRPKQSKRSRLLDMHTVIGVMTLPFTLMYAISGLIFNLVIIYQIAFALVLYKGDQQALLADAGYVELKPKWQDKAWQNPAIDQVFAEISSRENHQPVYVRMYNYGDESAVLQVGGDMTQQIGGQFDIATELATMQETALNDPINTNMVRKGLQVVANLHFGDYAGYDLRLLYFLLGLSVCVLIVAGNLLWIDKHFKHREENAKGKIIAEKYTLISTAGMIFALAVAFVLERTLAVDMSGRDQVLEYGFGLALLCTTVFVIGCKNAKACLANLLKASAIVVLLLVCYDLFNLSGKIKTLALNGHTQALWTDIALVLLSALGFYIAGYLQKKEQEKVVLAQVATTE